MIEGGRAETLRGLLEEEIWPQLPAELLDKALNFGDCLTYATACVEGEQLLAFDEFAQTDLQLAA